MSEPIHEGRTASDAEELREQVEQTRHELGQTVQALADKADVKARGQAKAAEVKDRAVHTAGELRHKAAEGAARLRDSLPGTVTEKASRTAGQAHAAATKAGHIWDEKAPEPVRAKAAQATRVARRYPALLAAAAAAAVWLVRRRKR
ncbi:DUF3618 domain-containing protein [Streptomyces wuyuanensis]|uniref:DUF3618 domain-containing protein n=1 Tax=Streptomyces wuyuanensis TaxID=1196353 RepID=UPI003D71B8DC